ncbi:MAG: efflux RND transporter periplasmic adaptor subunit [Caulobacterales bacterium]|nr:efflux RND transporter periplasmic adaptor subunit [Caulobacterales bacterium]
MTGVLGLVLGLVAILAVPEGTFFGRSALLANDGPTGERWACPMMDFVGTKPGACPVCGMTLQKVTAGELTREQAKRMGVQLATVEAGPAVATIRAYGAARYDDRTEQVVVARIAGRVVKRYGGALHPGLTVRVGDPLIDLYRPEAFTAQGELAAAVKLGDQQLVASIADRFGRWNLAHVAEAILKGGAPVDTVSIRSPYAGRVVLDEEMGKEGLVKIGAEIMPDRPLIRLVDPAAYMVVIHVPEPRARMLREGQAVHIASDDLGELPDVAASVSWVAPELNPEIRAREVHLHLRDPNKRLLPGSLVNARFQAVLGPDLTPADPDDKAAWGSFPLVPASAVLSTGVRNVVWKLEKVESDGRQRFSIAPVALGQRLEDADGNDRFVVRAGLQAGDQVAAQGSFLIDSQAQLAGSPSLLFPVGAAAPAPAHQH